MPIQNSDKINVVHGAYIYIRLDININSIILFMEKLPLNSHYSNVVLWNTLVNQSQVSKFNLVNYPMCWRMDFMQELLS